MNIVLITGDDWEGMYIDGKLVLEDHSLHPEHVLQALGIEVKSHLCDCNWLADRGSFPPDLTDVKLED